MAALRKTLVAPDAAPFAIFRERASDAAAREALLDVCFGQNRSHTHLPAAARRAPPPAEGLALSVVAHGDDS